MQPAIIGTSSNLQFDGCAANSEGSNLTGISFIQLLIETSIWGLIAPPAAREARKHHASAPAVSQNLAGHPEVQVHHSVACKEGDAQRHNDRRAVLHVGLPRQARQGQEVEAAQQAVGGNGQ